MIYVFICAVALLIGFAIFTIIKISNKEKNIAVKQSITCEEGVFNISGRAHTYRICKDDRFEFSIKDGQIISVKDNTAKTGTVKY